MPSNLCDRCVVLKTVKRHFSVEQLQAIYNYGIYSAASRETYRISKRGVKAKAKVRIIVSITSDRTSYCSLLVTSYAYGASIFEIEVHPTVLGIDPIIEFDSDSAKWLGIY